MEKSKTSTTPAGLKIFTHGEFYYKTETAKGVKPFEQVVRAASLDMFMESSQRYLGTEEDPATRLQVPKYKLQTYLNIRGQLKRRLLPIFLRKRFPEFARVRYVTIDEIVSETGAKLDLPIHLRSKAQLTQMIKDEKIPIDPSEYLEVDDLRTDILQFLQEPEAFLQQKPIKDKRRQEEKAFLAMNDLNEVAALPPMPTVKSTAPAKMRTGGGVLDD